MGYSQYDRWKLHPMLTSKSQTLESRKRRKKERRTLLIGLYEHYTAAMGMGGDSDDHCHY